MKHLYTVIILFLILLVSNKLIQLNVKTSTNDQNKFIGQETTKFTNSITLDQIYTLIESNDIGTLEKLLKNNNFSPISNNQSLTSSPLIYASELLRKDIVKMLLSFGFDANFTNYLGETPLIRTLYSINEASSNEDIHASFEITKLLVESGANINIESSENKTALEAAIIFDKLEIISYLIENGGDLFRLDVDSANYLFYCKSIDCIRLLVQKGLSINSNTQGGVNLLQSLISSSLLSIDSIEQVIMLGVDICHVDNENRSVVDYAELKGINNNLKKDNVEFFNKKKIENKKTELYQYLLKEYMSKCDN
ncbi:ankyrin repeat domain-containing protein [Marinicella sediminis]|uniref:Ankyrin repeat domain-containing protein n=1 Tax=Marinicella sediminis TaxID=1792834 RepID=A0ABV7JF95_9GAMM|nr:ankyrin repeat domain-containing protein [Marinicella sediminis]